MGQAEVARGGLLTQRVPGYKIFRLGNSNGPCFCGQYLNSWWTDGEAVAACLPGNMMWKQYAFPQEHRSPDAECYCGLHAYYDAGRASIALQPGLLMGLVAAAGKIVPHDDGFRAERMIVVAVFDPMRRADAEHAAGRHEAEIVRSVAGLERFEKYAGQRLPA